MAIALQDPSITWLGNANSVLWNLVAALLGFWAALGYRRVKGWRAARARTETFYAFFGRKPQYLIVHSAIKDDYLGESVWNYPATDTKAARMLARTFESVGLREGTDFDITTPLNVSESGTGKYSLAGKNLILLCGPARNEVFRKFMLNEETLDYSMVVGTNQRGDDCNILKDRHGTEFKASREAGTGTNGQEFDLAVVSSFPNPRDASLRIILLAGIHGTGTVAAAEKVCDLAGMRDVIGDPKTLLRGRAFARKLRAEYRKDDIETPTNVSWT